MLEKIIRAGSSLNRRRLTPAGIGTRTNVMLSEVKNLGLFLSSRSSSQQSEMFRFAQHDSANCPTQKCRVRNVIFG
jgi:hypothetical protein